MTFEQKLDRMKNEPCPCLRCGNCCERIPCALALFLDHPQAEGPCNFLRHDEQGKSACYLVTSQTDFLIRRSAAQLILSTGLCTNANGPKPEAIREYLAELYQQHQEHEHRKGA